MLPTILIAVAGLLLVLYLVRRRKRLRADD
ncbi:MAG: hypothetical protein DMF89_08375 [Acidobacteria bacterium]|nr:MAG: hypothetical protein DMF90_02260 [Acidobacteriota bacterium]PYR50685.1 MAG: hypothetical protein DMF89_08375 [Acidobacteriota bacterium]